MKNMWEVIIIGAGPAGATAARVLAQTGIDSLILEKKKIIGFPNHCGEGVSHHVLDFLHVDENRGWIIKKMKGSKIFFPNNKFLYYPQQSYCIDRTLFDQELINNATKAGARLLSQRNVIQINKENGRLRLTTRNGEDFTCKYLIAADGALSMVRRSLGINDNFVMALQYKFEPITKLEDEYFVFFSNEKYNPGFAWIFSRGIETSIGLCSIGNLKKKLEDFINVLGIDSTKRKTVHCGAIPNPIKPMKIVLPGILFAGDAGGFTFPLTGAGIIGALVSGKIAGETIKDAIMQHEPEILFEYPERLKKHPSRSITTLFYCHEFFSLNNNALNAIGAVIDKRNYWEVPVIEVPHYILKNPNLDTMRGLFVGFTARQILSHYDQYVF